jgi:hypothetical protein
MKAVRDELLAAAKNLDFTELSGDRDLAGLAFGGAAEQQTAA